MRELIQACRKCYKFIQHKGALWGNYLCQAILLGLSFIQPYVFAMVIECLAKSYTPGVYRSIIVITALCIMKIICSACSFFSKLQVKKDSRIYKGEAACAPVSVTPVQQTDAGFR